MSANFGLTTSTPAVNVIQSINYLLATQGQSTGGNVNLGNVVQVSGNNAIYSSNAGIIGYINGYVDVKYANSATGGSGFSSNSTMATYYGVYNSPTNSESSNPVNYQWYQVAGGFGTNKGLYYTTGGGNSISFQVGSTAPNQYYQPVPDNTPIVLASISANLVVANSLANSSVTTNAIAQAAVTGYNIAANTITANNITSGTITGNLISANTITAYNIATNTITANNIASGTIIAQNIAAGTIVGSLIAANTIVGSSIVAGSITATELAANLLVVGNINSIGQTLGAYTGNGYWLENTTGNVYFGGNAYIGGNLNVVGLITAGSLANATVNTTTIVTQAVSQGYGITDNTLEVLQTSPTANVYYPSTAYGSFTTTYNNESLYVLGQVTTYITITGGSGTTFTPQMFFRVRRVTPSGTTILQSWSQVNPALGESGGNSYLNTTFALYDLISTPQYNQYYMDIAWGTTGSTIYVSTLNQSFGSMTIQALKR